MKYVLNLISKRRCKAIGSPCAIFNSCLRIGYYLVFWKTSLVIPVPKLSRDLLIISNVWSITSIKNLSKVLGKKLYYIVQKFTLTPTMSSFPINMDLNHNFQ